MQMLERKHKGRFNLASSTSRLRQLSSRTARESPPRAAAISTPASTNVRTLLLIAGADIETAPPLGLLPLDLFIR